MLICNVLFKRQVKVTVPNMWNPNITHVRLAFRFCHLYSAALPPFHVYTRQNSKQYTPPIRVYIHRLKAVKTNYVWSFLKQFGKEIRSWNSPSDPRYLSNHLSLQITDFSKLCLHDFLLTDSVLSTHWLEYLGYDFVKVVAILQVGHAWKVRWSQKLVRHVVHHIIENYQLDFIG